MGGGRAHLRRHYRTLRARGFLLGLLVLLLEKLFRFGVQHQSSSCVSGRRAAGKPGGAPPLFQIPRAARQPKDETRDRQPRDRRGPREGCVLVFADDHDAPTVLPRQDGIQPNPLPGTNKSAGQSVRLSVVCTGGRGARLCTLASHEGLGWWLSGGAHSGQASGRAWAFCSQSSS